MDPLDDNPSMTDFLNHPNINHLIEHLCRQLHCYIKANDEENAARTRDLMTKLENKEIFERILGPEEFDADLDLENLPSSNDEIVEQKSEYDELPEIMMIPDEGEEEGCCPPCYPEPILPELPESAWHGYFNGYQILTESDEFCIGESKKCLELVRDMCDEELEGFLRVGVKCFCIDLFAGNEFENLELIRRLREVEKNLTKEIGYPINSTLIAKLSPRLQYTGDLDQKLLKASGAQNFVLQKGDELILTIRRQYASRCSNKHIFVNATKLMIDVQPCDIICIGPDIQVSVKRVGIFELNCNVLLGGVLLSRLPVLYPGRCNRFSVSVEELEDLTFAKEMGINVIVSRIVGTKEYFDDLLKILELFQCEGMRLLATVVLNEMRVCEEDYKWAVDGYDGFLVELAPLVNENYHEMLKICPAAANFIERAYELQKPIIFDPKAMTDNQYSVDPDHFLHVFYYPDKYMFKCADIRSAFNFFCLQHAIFSPLPEQVLSKLPYCDKSHTGSDSLARATVSAAFEMDATAIFVLGVTGRMATKMAHFRPKIPIIFVTQMKSASKFVGLFHNIILLYYRSKLVHASHQLSVYKHFLYGLLYAKDRRIINHEDNVIFVYNHNEKTKLPDKYISYKFDQLHFASHLKQILFPGAESFL